MAAGHDLKNHDLENHDLENHDLENGVKLFYIVRRKNALREPKLEPQNHLLAILQCHQLESPKVL